MPFADWAPAIKIHMEAVHTAALAAEAIPNLGKVYGYNEWPPTMSVFPGSLIGTLGGSQGYSLGGPNIAHHNITIWTYFLLSTSLTEAQKMAFPFIELVRNEFAGDLKLGATVDHFWPVTPPALFYEGPGVLEYAGKNYAGLFFNYDLKETETFTVAA